jgi:hypothetical protein
MLYYGARQNKNEVCYLSSKFKFLHINNFESLLLVGQKRGLVKARVGSESAWWPRVYCITGHVIKLLSYSHARQLQHVPGITSFLRNTTQCNYLTYSSFSIVSLCNYTILPAAVKVLETFLRASLWEPFQLFRHILIYVSNITKALALQCWFKSRKQ